MFFVVQAFCNAKTITIIPEFLYHYVQHQSGRITVKYRKKDLDALKFVDMLNQNYYKVGEINKFVYAVLTFRGISSCLIYKYITKYFFDKQAKEMIDITIRNESFMEAVKLCATEKNIPRRDKYLAILLDKVSFLYKIIIYFLVTVKNLLHK
jgi:hypothetical protein